MKAAPVSYSETSEMRLRKSTQEISKAARQNQWCAALKLLAEMQDQGLVPDVITYNAAISACEKGSQWQQALKLLAEMQGQGLEPDLCTCMHLPFFGLRSKSGFSVFCCVTGCVWLFVCCLILVRNHLQRCLRERVLILQMRLKQVQGICKSLSAPIGKTI